MWVMRYDVKFTQLLWYAWRLVKEEVKNTKRFLRGLKPRIKSKLVSFQLRIYSQALEKALEVERDMYENQEC